jgi:Sulfotransferase family
MRRWLVSSGVGYGRSVRPQLVVLHIEKTAGTSLRRSVLEPNLQRVEYFGGLRHFRASDDVDCIHGHIAYGYHRIVRRPIVYTTMLREPVDRALSFYYFIRDEVRIDLFERHPLRNYADSVTIGQFFRNPRFSNISTRRLAGIEFDRAYPYMHKSRAFRRAMFDASKRHLQEMPVFGLQHRYEESQARVLDYLGAEKIENGPRANETKNRPSTQEIAANYPGVLDQLVASHELDLELFWWACELFKRQSGPSRERPAPGETYPRSGPPPS